MGGVHLGIVAADTGFYRHFADGALFSFVRHGWADVFMVTPVFWGLCLALGVIAFHVLLMLFGFGFWLWCVPALCLLVPLARKDWPRLAGQENV